MLVRFIKRPTHTGWKLSQSNLMTIRLILLFFLVSSFWTSLFGQEVPFPQIPCSAYRYQVTSTDINTNSKLWRYHPVTGKRTLMGTLNYYVNAIGYNIKDHYIWGARVNGSIVSIGIDGSTTSYAITGLPSSEYIIGDVSPDGYYYLYDSGNQIYYTIDLDPSRATYLKLVNPTNNYVVDGRSPKGTPLASEIAIDDWAYNPQDGLLYGVIRATTVTINNGNAFSVNTLDPVTNTRVWKKKVDNSGGFREPKTATSRFFGATFFDNSGNFYAVANASGNFFKIDLTTDPHKSILLSDPSLGIAVTKNDGAGCPTAPMAIDLGDAPSSYGTAMNDTAAVHAVNDSLKIGSIIDSDSDGKPSADAQGDNLDNADDEDGISQILAQTVLNSSFSIPVKVTNITGVDAVLAGWIDFNKNGEYETSERSEVIVADGATSATLVWNGVTVSVIDNHFLRLRLARDASEVANPVGAASDGEIEDHLIGISVDYGDAPDTYGTLLGSNGASHIYKAGLGIGNNLDGELDGYPSADGTGDDLQEGDDEDGYDSNSVLNISGNQISIVINVINETGSEATLSGWFDFNKNGIFELSERAQTVVPHAATTATLTWTNAPAENNAKYFLRLRIASDASEVANAVGVANSGEVEDYYPMTTLPVKLSAFSVHKESQTAAVTWETAAEINAAKFEVERSKDAKNWKVIGQELASNDVSNHYSIIDSAPLSGTNYYRLKMIDQDGTFAYSRIERLTWESDAAYVYPNPASDKLYFTVDKSQKVKSLQIQTMSGEVVTILEATQDYVDIHTLREGGYILTITFEDGTKTSYKFVRGVK